MPGPATRPAESRLGVPSIPAPVRSTVRYKARRLLRHPALRHRHDDLADIEQTLLLELLRRSTRFDPGRGTYATFADRVVRNAGRRIIEHALREKRCVFRVAGSLDDDSPYRSPGAAASTQGQWLHSQIRHTDSTGDAIGRRVDVRRVVSRLAMADQRICALLAIETTSAVARMLGISRSALYRRLRKIRTHFTDHGMGEYVGAIASVYKPDSSRRHAVSNQ